MHGVPVKLVCATALVLGGCGATPSTHGAAGPGTSDVNPPDATTQVIDSGTGMPDAEPIGPSGSPRCKHVEVVEGCSDGWCRIPAGCFIMGSPESEIGHPADSPVERMVEVTLTHSFLIGQHEVTQKLWDEETSTVSFRLARTLFAAANASPP